MASRFLTPWSAARGGWLPEPLYQLQREIDRAFDDAFSGGSGGRSGGAMAMTAPKIDLHESDGELCLRADLPGIQPSDLDVRVEGDVLTIRGERKSENERNEQNFHVMERSHGRFQRSIQLPFTPNPDEVHAEVRHGVLEVRMPKHAPQERSRRIEVRGAEQQGSSAQAIGGGAQGGGGGASMTQAVGGGAGSQGAPSRSSASTGASSGAGAGGASGRDPSSAGSTGQGPGGASSVTPGVGSGSQGGRGSEGGLAGTSGGPTAAPAGETSSSSR